MAKKKTKLFEYRGRRIRVSDKNLVRRFMIISLTPIFLLVFFVINQYWIFDFAELEKGIESVKISFLNPFSLLVIGSIFLGIFTCIAFRLIYLKCLGEHYTKLRHRQLISRMFLENGWYEVIKKPDSKREKIILPKTYYSFKHGDIVIHVSITMGRYQENLLSLEKKLEVGLFAELIYVEQQERFIKYILAYDMSGSRIHIDEVKISKDKMTLMKNVSWNFRKLPHMLIAGGTGSGKTYYILTLIEIILHTDANLVILDPKRLDLSNLEVVLPNVYYEQDSMIEAIKGFYEGMVTRADEMKKMPNYKMGKDYSYMGLPANFLIFDEYVSLIEMLDNKLRVEILSLLLKIAMLGRQSGYFVILACQRPDASYMGSGTRDQFHFRVALGLMSEQGYAMMFGEIKKKLFFKDIKGRGYVDAGRGVITEFYAPFIDEGHDFLERIGELYKARKELNEEEVTNE